MARASLLLVLTLSALWAGGASPRAQGDLDTFMKQVLERRDDNWKKLQQYVLDERETVDVRGPAGLPLWGERRDYTWFIKDGYFVRSPLAVNGAKVGETDRRKYEADFLRREQERDRRERERSASGEPMPPSPAPSGSAAPPRDLDGLVRQTRQPQFISSAYFLRFKFDEGRYALVGREPLDGREVLRVEYYPRKLFADDRQRSRDRKDGDARREAYDAQLQRLMNKTSKVTLWIEPVSHQILKYTFEDLGWDFFPGAWLVRVQQVRASMTMGQPFPDVWLPSGLEMHVTMALASGDVDLRYALEYHDYRQAEVTSRIGPPGGR
jgi:hypothetical protein